MEFYTDLLRAIDFENTCWSRPVKPHLGISHVVYKEDIMCLGETYSIFKELTRRAGTSRVVGIVQPQGFGACNHLSWDGFEIRQPIVLAMQRDFVRNTPDQFDRGCINRISRVRYECDIAGVD